MKVRASETLLQALAVCAELTQAELTPAAAKVMANDLARYPEAQVLPALERCRRELRPRQFCLAAVIERLDDGRPGPEEAWAMLPKDEYASAFWTEEMRHAARVCRALLFDGDTVQARMAFLEKYKALVQAARDAGKPVQWTPTLGIDKAGREVAILEAAERGYIKPETACEMLPNREDPTLAARLSSLTGAPAPAALPAPSDNRPERWRQLGEALRYSARRTTAKATV